MVANRVLVIAVCCVLFTSTPACADDEKQPEPEKFAVIGFPGIDADELVDLAKKRLGHTKIVRIPLFNSVLVWGTHEELLDVLKFLTPL